MYLNPKENLRDPEQYINFVYNQHIEDTFSKEDLQDWYRFTNRACLQIGELKNNKSQDEQNKLEVIRLKGVDTMQRIRKRIKKFDLRS